METINSVASAAAKAVWGEGEVSKKEPVSGVKGDVSKGEPYDAGNLDTPSQEKVEMRLGNTGNLDGPPASDKPTTTHTASAPPKGDTSGGQNDTRHPDDVPDTLDPSKLKGPGPKPVEVIAKQHGGDAGQAKKPSPDSSNFTGLGSGSSGVGNGQEEVKKETASTGTGDSYVKTTGFNADGGDFDAKNPGAGKEADRLVHQKHSNDESIPAATASTNQPLSPTTEADAAHGDSSPSSKHSKNKPSLSERIKAKLHRH